MFQKIHKNQNRFAGKPTMNKPKNQNRFAGKPAINKPKIFSVFAKLFYFCLSKKILIIFTKNIRQNIAFIGVFHKHRDYSRFNDAFFEICGNPTNYFLLSVKIKKFCIFRKYFWLSVFCLFITGFSANLFWFFCIFGFFPKQIREQATTNKQKIEQITPFLCNQTTNIFHRVMTEFTKDGITFKLANCEIFAETTDFIFHNSFPTENDVVLFNHLLKKHNELYNLTCSVVKCGIDSTLGVTFTSNHANGCNHKIEYIFKCVDINKKGMLLEKLKQMGYKMELLRKRIAEDQAKLEQMEKEYVDEMCNMEH